MKSRLTMITDIITEYSVLGAAWVAINVFVYNGSALIAVFTFLAASPFLLAFLVGYHLMNRDKPKDEQKEIPKEQG
jgi:ABC-type polysaccharide/polyol phosphate export permease